MSVAIAKLYGTALSGRSDDRPELADTPIPLEAHLPAVPCRGGEGLIRELFEPLGYEVQATPDHAGCGAFPIGATAGTSGSRFAESSGCATCCGISTCSFR